MKYEYQISVILPSLNVVNYIDECLESVKKQTCSRIEMICVDAGSNDGTYEYLIKMSKNDKRIKVIRSEKKSYGYQLNLGIKQAKGKYIAIVETDDLIDNHMLEILYGYAEDKQLDFVKADYKGFVDEADERIVTTYKTLSGYEELYGKVINTSDYLFLFQQDQSLWKGIYRKDFLEHNHIVFHETNGAAYQDIGFTMQILSLSNKAMYIPMCFYLYRMDREESSSFKPQVLQFIQAEFEWIFCSLQIENKGIYYRLSCAFIAELEVLLYRLNYEMNKEYILEPYEWITNKINYAISSDILSEQDFEPDRWTDLQLALTDLRTYICCKKTKFEIAKDRQNHLLRFAKNEKIIVWGTGINGIQVKQILQHMGIDIVAFADNDADKWGGKVGKTEILSKAECLERYSDASYVIANSVHWLEIKKDLQKNGIKKVFLWR